MEHHKEPHKSHEAHKHHTAHEQHHPAHDSQSHRHDTHIVHHKPRSSDLSGKLVLALTAILLLLVAYNIFQVASFNKMLDTKIKEAKEATRPADISLAVITTASCKDCYDINAAVSIIESSDVKVVSKKEFDYKSKEAKQLIETYGIKNVPTVIVKGELDRAKSLKSKFKRMGEEKDNALVFTSLEPPYIEAATDKVRGKITITTLLKDNCDHCQDLSLVIKQLKDSGIKFKDEKTLNADSDEGKAAISKYSIKKLPALIMDKEAEVYTNIQQSWNQVGTVEADGSYVMRNLTPPYYSVDDKRVVGYITKTVLSDSSCSKCYDPDKFHKPILQRMGVIFDKENKVDISTDEGKALIKKYSIEKVPTILLSGDVNVYPVLISAWQGVGDVDKDGTYVFRKVDVAVQPYKDLKTGQVVEPAPPQQQQQ